MRTAKRNLSRRQALKALTASVASFGVYALNLNDQVVRMRPSDITSRYHQAGDWSFFGRI